MYMISCSIPLSTKAMDSISNGFIVVAYIVIVTVMILIVYIDSKNNAIIPESRRESKPTDAGKSYMIEDTVKLHVHVHHVHCTFEMATCTCS